MGPHPLCGRIILGYAASHRCGMKSVPLEGFGGMPKTLRQAPTTSGIQQASGIMAYVDSVHSGGDVGIGDVTVHTHALYGLISQHVVSENLVCSFAVVRQLFGCNLLAFWLSTYLPFMFFVLWPLVWSLCGLPSRMPICDYYLHFLVRCGLAVIMLFRATRSNVKRLMYAFLFDNPSAKPTRVARPARFVGFRRHKPVRRRKSSSIRFSKCCCRVLLTLFYASLLWKVQLAWTISRKDRNRCAHVVHGNGGKGSSKSGRKGAMRPTSRDVTFPTDPTNTPDDQDLLEQIKAVLPEAAVVRAQSTLDPSEWDVPIAHPQRLDNKGGIALVPKTLLPSVLQRVGYTAAPTAVLT